MLQESDVIDYLERLALLKFTESEREKVRIEIIKIIELFNELMKVEELDRVEPLYHVIEIELPLRDDEPLDTVDSSHELLSENAILENGYIKAPKTVGE
uniref:Asp-tRNA(Asn)/Glu-tRNA(Gln) amidotransferase subunit GatC n=1 Tax=Ignisphaera aggregans TaxID=334771 RepID=A0A7J2U1L5_9CREN